MSGGSRQGRKRRDHRSQHSWVMIIKYELSIFLREHRKQLNCNYLICFLVHPMFSAKTHEKRVLVESQTRKQGLPVLGSTYLETPAVALA